MQVCDQAFDFAKARHRQGRADDFERYQRGRKPTQYFFGGLADAAREGFFIVVLASKLLQQREIEFDHPLAGRIPDEHALIPPAAADAGTDAFGDNPGQCVEGKAIHLELHADATRRAVRIQCLQWHEQCRCFECHVVRVLSQVGGSRPVTHGCSLR